MLMIRLRSAELLRRVRQNDGYCLCTIERTRDARCPCKDFRASAVPGPCHCGVWEKVECSPTQADDVAKEQAERRRDDLTGHDL